MPPMTSSRAGTRATQTSPLLKKPAFPLIYRVRLGRRFEVDGKVKRAVADMEHYHHEAMAGSAQVRTESVQHNSKAVA